MFTVKTIINKTVHLHHLKEPIIGLPGSDMWNQVMDNLLQCYNREVEFAAEAPFSSTEPRLALVPATEWRELPAYDFLEYHPQTFLDANANEVQFPEEMIEAKRPGYLLQDCVGILLLDAKHPERGALNDCEWTRGAFYQLLYPGDLLFATDCHGATVHKIA